MEEGAAVLGTLQIRGRRPPGGGGGRREVENGAFQKKAVGDDMQLPASKHFMDLISSKEFEKKVDGIRRGLPVWVVGHFRVVPGYAVPIRRGT